ncbi:MAG: IS66 family transposase [Treponema sp.]|nr:IS66 family transposase [Treponema sp.]
MQLTEINTASTDPQFLPYIQHIKRLENEIEILKEQVNILLLKRFGRSSEQYDPSQQPLFTEEAEAGSPPETKNEKQEVKSYIRHKAGRKAIDPKIERREKIIDIPEDEKMCACGHGMVRIGEETSEKLHIEQPVIYVEKTVRPKYACRHCEGTEDEGRPAVRIAPVPPSIIPRSIASASLLSYIMIQKYQDHIPFHRQEAQFLRIGADVSRQDMSNWQQNVYAFLEPLYSILKKTIKTGPVMRMDETTAQVMGEEGRDDTRTSYIWLAKGGPPGKVVVLYEYRATHEAKHAKELLEGFSGYLQTDGNESYDTAVKGMPGIIHVGCLAHVRRKFYEASKAAKKPQSAEEGLKFIRRLYEIENDLREKKYGGEQFLAERRELAGPVLADFYKWLNKRSNEILPSGLLGKAVGYALNQWGKVIRYLESPYLTPDNNASENAIRPYVLGRKNYMFHMSPEGASSSCGMYTLIETAKQNGVEPSKYLRELFEKAPYAKSAEDWEKLLPWNIFNP